MMRILALVNFCLILHIAESEISFECELIRGRQSLFSYEDEVFGFHNVEKCVVSNVTTNNEIYKAFEQLDINVKMIEFASSKIETGFSSSIAKFSKLNFIKAAGVGMKSLLPGFLAGHERFTLIDLSNNEITEILANTFASIFIESLDLSDNKITTIDDMAFNASKIQKLDLSNNLMKKVTFVQNMVAFGLLDFSQNLIEDVKIVSSNENYIPTKGTMLTRLGFFGLNPTIKLSDNKNLKSFECNSKIESFGLFYLSNCSKLTDVKLNNCSVSLYVSESRNLKKLEVTENLRGLVAENTKIMEIDFSKANKLLTLRMENASIPDEVFNQILNIKSLTTLDLTNKYIGPVNISTFANLTNLSHLKLKGTKISGITFGTFSHQSKVEYLNLADNNLDAFDVNMIFSMSNLNTLDISGNEITEVVNAEKIHHFFSQLRNIDLTKNKFSCKTLMNLVSYMKKHKISLQKSNIEHHETNIQGVICTHIDGEDEIPQFDISDASASEIQSKINQLTEKLNSHSDKIQILLTKPVSSGKSLEVQNSTLMESSLIIVCICFTIFMGLKVFLIVKSNFLEGSRRRGFPLLSQSEPMGHSDI